jgi:RHS repeat-associated protein
LPYGDVRYGFTGHEHDDRHLVNMRGRIYDAQLGRFLSTDPIIGHLLDGQSYNSYSYVLNNPLSFTDPAGLQGLPSQSRISGIEVRTVGEAGCATCGVPVKLGGVWRTTAPDYNAPGMTHGGGPSGIETGSRPKAADDRGTREMPTPAALQAAYETNKGTSTGIYQTPTGDLPPISEQQLIENSRMYMSGRVGTTDCPVCHLLDPSSPIRPTTQAEKLGTIGVFTLGMALIGGPIVGEPLLLLSAPPAAMSAPGAAALGAAVGQSGLAAIIRESQGSIQRAVELINRAAVSQRDAIEVIRQVVAMSNREMGDVSGPAGSIYLVAKSGILNQWPMVHITAEGLARFGQGTLSPTGVTGFVPK